MSDGLFDETVLRRSLRLERDEVPAGLDAAVLAAAARQVERSRHTLAVLLGAVAATGAAGVLVWGALLGAAPLAWPVLLPPALGALAAVATALVPLAEAAAEPVVPASLVAVLAVAIVYELTEKRKGFRRVHPS